MTSRDLYEYALIELNKLEAPSLLLEDYNYFINKAVQQYINLTYAKLEVDQQSTDDLRVLKTTAVLEPLVSMSSSDKPLFEASYHVDLPDDYLHMINCIVEYKVTGGNFKCYNNNDVVHFAARRLTSDMYSQILNNAYLRPTYKRPYYFINNINTEIDPLPTNPSMDDAITNSTHKGSTEVAYNRLANVSKVRVEIRFGNDASVFVPQRLYIDYIKAPMYIRLTQDQIDTTIDTSQVLEFPDYVCFEIVNIFTRLVMENASDPRLQTNMPINNTITNPVIQQQQAQQK